MKKLLSILNKVGLVCFFANGWSAETFDALLAGNSNLNEYGPVAAGITTSGDLKEIILASSPGFFNSCSINQIGYGLIGGAKGAPQEPYLITINPQGEVAVIPKNFLFNLGQIVSTSINMTNVGLIGGNLDGPSNLLQYVAKINQDSTIVPIIDSDIGRITSVFLVDSGEGLVGGAYDAPEKFYLSKISETNNVLNLMPAQIDKLGAINSVALNDHHQGVAGGIYTPTPSGYFPYGVLVDKDNTVIEINLAGGTDEYCYSVAINDQGTAIFGLYKRGVSGNYAAIADFNNNLNFINPADFPSTGIIRGVAINNAGLCVIAGAGFDNSPIAAFIYPNGEIKRIDPSKLIPEGGFYSAALSEQGVCLLGGESYLDPYPLFAAIVAPDGTVTKLPNIQGGPSIFSVSMGNLGVPTTFSSSSASTPLINLSSQVLSNHLITLKSPNGSNPSNVALLVDANPKLKTNNQLGSCSSRLNDSKYDIWVAPMFYNSYQDAQSGWPKITNWVAGGIAGFDYHGFENGLIGGGFAYAFDRVNLGNSMGHSTYNEEFATLYGAWMREHFYINLAAWGGYYNVNNRRSNLLNTASTSNYDGWMLLPHMEVSIPYYAKECWFLVDPFVMLDWANNWQSSVEEAGPLGLNLVLEDSYSSLLRTEVGLRLSETLTRDWGNIVFLEKGSYVNKVPFGSQSTQATFVGGISSFGVETLNDRIQNLGVVQLCATLQPSNSKRPYASLNYQGEFGSSFQSHLISIEAGVNF